MQFPFQTIFCIVLMTVSLLATTARAQDSAKLSLGLPIACQLNQDCWVVNYMDQDPGPDVKDFGCGGRTYDDHTGNDFAVKDLATMSRGVSVIASAPGTVIGVRDGMPDVSVKAVGKDTVTGKECGNGVMLDHGNGWTTQYCHMKQGSISVNKGDVVSRGQPLGQVGLSGNTEFPHVHLTVRHHGQVIDPFTGKPAANQCDLNPSSGLWQPQLSQLMQYQPAIIYNAGVSTTVPDMNMVRAGQAMAFPRFAQDPYLVMWADILGVEQGDKIRFTLTGPDGKQVLTHEHLIPRRMAIWFGYTGKRKPRKWQAGAYQARIHLIRPGQNVERSKIIPFRLQ